MPRAYQKMLQEVARRRQFQERYLAEREQTRLRLARMAEEENSRRQTFLHNHGCHLPAELSQGLGSQVPHVSMSIKAFDEQLPEIDYKSLLDGSCITATQSSISETPPKRPDIAPPVPASSFSLGQAETVFRDRASSTSGSSSQVAQAGTGSSGPEAASVLGQSQDGGT